MVLRELMVETLRHGVPVTAAVVGGFHANRKRAGLWPSIGWTLGSWGGAWIAQYVVLNLLEGAGQRNLSASMPSASIQGGAATPRQMDYSQPISQAGPAYQEPAAVAAVASAPTPSPSSPLAGVAYDGARKVSDGGSVQVKGTFTGGGAFGSPYGGG